MEWRQQTSVSCADAFNEAQRWIQEVTGKLFGCNDFRAALENGVLLCDLINRLKPGIIKRVNRLSTPIAGLDNVNVFLKACGKLGLNVSQLFHPGDLQDLSSRATLRRDETNRRLKNVLVTIYWLGRKAHQDSFYSGPQLNVKAFEGLLGLALSKALDEGSHSFVKESCLDSLDSRVFHQNSEGWGSDAEAEQVFKMETTQPSTQQNKGYIPHPLLRRKQGREESGRGCAGPIASIEEDPLSPQPHLTTFPPISAIDEELFLSALCEEDSEDDYADADPVLDDLYFRRVQQTLHQTSNNPNYDRYLPKYWTPEEETRVQTIFLGSQRRPWYRKMLGLRAYQSQVRPERPVQVNPGWIWSKSLSDIPMVYPVRKLPGEHTIYDEDLDTNMANEWNQENKRRCSVAAKDSEAKWQDDFSKWKNRRTSTKSDRRKSLDREHVITQMANGAGIKFEKNEAQGGLLKSDQQSPRRHFPAPRPYCTSPHSKSLSSDLRPHTRALLARSYATEPPFSPQAPLSSQNSSHTQGSSVGAMPASDASILGEETHFASLASHGAEVTTPPLDGSFSFQAQVKVQESPAPVQPTSEEAQSVNVLTNQISTLVTTIQPKAGVDGLEDLSHKNHKSQEESQKMSWEPAVEHGSGQQAAAGYNFMSKTGSWSGSASLPRGYRRSEGSSRLSSAITARPFGSKSRVSSLPRLFNVDNNQGLLMDSEKEEALSPTNKSSLKRQTATTHLKVQHVTVRQKKANQAQQSGPEQVEVKGATLSSQSSFQTIGYHHQQNTQTQLVQQPHSSLQTQNNTGSTLQSSASIDLPKVDHSDMRVSLTLKPNSRPDFGFQTHWDSRGARVQFIQPGSPAEQCQLCVDDEVVAVNGVAVAHLNYNQWKDKMTSSLQNGRLTMDIRRYGNKDWSNSEESHHKQPGCSRMTLNLTSAGSSLIGCPDRHAISGTSSETPVRKFNGQTDDVLQSKVIHGEPADSHKTAGSKDYNIISRKNQKRREEFFKQKGGSESAISDLQVPSLSPSSSSWSWDREGDRRRQEKWQEEQERLLQEQYRRDQERLESEWRRAQQDAKGEVCWKPGQKTFEMTNGGESTASTQLHVNGFTNKNIQAEKSSDRDELKDEGTTPQSNAQGEQHDKIYGPAWPEDSCGFVKLSPAHRAKSFSTSALASTHKQTRGPGDERKRKGQSASNAEKERQLILQEMKKRTLLLTDNSWIRQRTSSFYKEPIYVGVPMKRYESLDDLDTLRQSHPLVTTFSYPRPQSAAAGYCVPSRNSSSRYSTGSILSQKSTFDSSHHPRMVISASTSPVSSVWAATDISEEVRLESRFESETGSPTVSRAISNSSLLVPPPCDQDGILQITD
ncbi:LIM domain only protein 7 [Dissostichus eleginoides]|uniref:LIM domain only protein 7 n=1 Tax=Dissostichus eleginoides TaxID=100907 RepID=A0AAD9F793_DISEL|nr:LIM domain only protein 7 [Dissostichus eleginoides]